MKSVIIDGVRYVPEKKKSDTQGVSDEVLERRALFEYYENRSAKEMKEHYDESHRVW